VNYDVNESSTEEEGSSSEDVIENFSENESDDRSRLKPSIGDVVVVVYEVKKKTLRFLGLVQQIESENVTVQYLKRSGEKRWRYRHHNFRKNHNCDKSRKFFCKFSGSVYFQCCTPCFVNVNKISNKFK